jgi:hypothetical protein
MTKLSIDIVVSGYYVKTINGSWKQTTKPVSSMLRVCNDYIRTMVLDDKLDEFGLFGITLREYQIKIRHIKWDVKYNVGDNV